MGTRNRNSAFSSRALPPLAEFEREEGSPRSEASALFTATQRRLLMLLYGQADRAFHMQELFANTGNGNGAVQRTLARLEAAGLVGCEFVRGRKYYRANPQAGIFRELEALVRGSFGMAEPLREAFAALEPCAALCFAYLPKQSWPLPAPALDLLLVLKPGTAPPPSEDLLAALRDARLRLARDFTLSRIVDVEALRAPDDFVAYALSQPRTRIFGDERVLAGMAERRAEAKCVAKV